MFFKNYKLNFLRQNCGISPTSGGGGHVPLVQVQVEGVGYGGGGLDEKTFEFRQLKDLQSKKFSDAPPPR